MQTISSRTQCTDHFKSESFFRHRRRLRAIRAAGQAWFCLADLARLMGTRLDERSTLKLDPDQHRVAWIECHGLWEHCLMISESGVFALLIHHYIPENRALRQWITRQVLPALRRRDLDRYEAPQVSRLEWLGNTLLMLQWRNESWIQWRDLPPLAGQQVQAARKGFWQRLYRKAVMHMRR